MERLVNMKWQPNENHGKPCDKCGSTKDVRECRVVVRNYRRLKKPQFEYECLECMKWKFQHNTMAKREACKNGCVCK